MLLNKFKLITLKEYPGRHRTYSTSTSSALMNRDSTITYEDFTIESTSLQPISGRTLQSLPEGYREQAEYTFWTTTGIVGISSDASTLPDQIQYKGKWYSIYSLDGWTENTFLMHNQCVAILDDQDNSWDYNTSGGNYG